MIHLFINALGASAGGGLTYLRNVVPVLRSRNDIRATVLVNRRLQLDLPDSKNVNILALETPTSTALRFLFEQKKVPSLLSQVKADVLLSVGNFALWNCPIHQILLSRNALYTSSDFERDLKRRGDYRLWIDNAFKAEIARASIRIAQVTVAPSQSFAEELRQWSGVPVEAIYHGFDKSLFRADSQPIRREMEESVFRPDGALRLLFVSHYNYYRNFETLFRAIALLKNLLAPRTVRLFLTCHLRENANPGSYRTGDASALVRDLRISDNIVELGAVSYGLLHHVYSKADFYVTPAYCESFAHPLIEAMSTGIPIVASDIPVHREICRDSAVYFGRFSAVELAQAVVQLANSRSSVDRLSAAGLQRSQEFSWISHLDSILSLADRLVAASASKI